jgi:hypothetical protein
MSGDTRYDGELQMYVHGCVDVASLLVPARARKAIMSP